MSRYNGLHHLALVTGDLDRTIRFWRDLLQMRLVATLGAPGYRQCFFEVSEHDLIAFFEWPEVEQLPEKDHGVPVSGPFGFDHVAIGVDRKSDLWELKDRLEAADFWASEVVDHGLFLSLYSFDPNEIPIEFVYAVADRDPRIHPLLADKEPTKIQSEGTEPQSDVWPEPSESTEVPDQRVYPGYGSELF